MESIVENGYLRHVGHELVDGLQACQVALVVHGSQVDEALDAFLHLGSNDATLLEEVTALHYTMANGIYLVKALQCSELRVEQALEHEVDAFLVVGHVVHDNLLLSIRHSNLYECLIESDTLNTTLCQNGLIVHVVKLVLDR